MQTKWNLLGLFVLLLSCEASVTPPEHKHDGEEKPVKKKPESVSSLAESIHILKQRFIDPEIQTLRRQYWRDAFNEIKNITGVFSTSESNPSGRSILSQWKLLLDDASSSKIASSAESDAAPTTARGETPTARFEGFASWDRMLQDWADDVQEYVDSVQAESEDGYSFGNFGRPSVTVEVTKQADDSLAEEVKPVDSSTEEIKQLGSLVEEIKQTRYVEETKISDSSQNMLHDGVEAIDAAKIEQVLKKEKVSLPVPAPRKHGEAILPHTDVSDKSKRILVVTTAALPWMTGTAVNPLLRAAYLTNGRKAAGGSVILMIPWVERAADQKRVYGDRTFESPEVQEDYIRAWLRDSAKMAQASEDLIIRWYTAWHNELENSIYSMGDITALIPSDSVDICILEEPEHLNW
jgi:hypothetical protein